MEDGRAGGRYEALTSVRGLAAWWVVIYHFRDALVGAVPGVVMAVFDRGYLAVDMFFVLSGFVIALNYRTWFEHAMTDRWVRFLGLRLARIYPLHLFILLLYLVDPIAVLLWSSRGDLSQYPVGYFLQSLVLVQAWGLSPGAAWNVPAWSISAEWLVYLLFPLVAFAAARVIRGPWSAVAWTALPLAALFLGPPLFGTDLVTTMTGLAVVRCLLEFSAGFGVMHLRTMLAGRKGLSYVALAFGVIVLGLVVDGSLPDEWAAVAFAALIFGLADPTIVAVRWMGGNGLVGRVLLTLGAVSYSTYLCHFLIRSWVRFVLIQPGSNRVPAFVVYVAMTALASPLLYLLIERPGRSWGRAVLGVQPRAAMVTVR